MADEIVDLATLVALVKALTEKVDALTTAVAALTPGTGTPPDPGTGTGKPIPPVIDLWGLLTSNDDSYWPEEALGPAPTLTADGWRRDGGIKILEARFPYFNRVPIICAFWCGINLNGYGGGDWNQLLRKREFIRETYKGGNEKFVALCQKYGLDPDMAYFLVLDGGIDPLDKLFGARLESDMNTFKDKSLEAYVTHQLDRLNAQPGGGPGMGGASV